MLSIQFTAPDELYGGILYCPLQDAYEKLYEGELFPIKMLGCSVDSVYIACYDSLCYYM